MNHIDRLCAGELDLVVVQSNGSISSEPPASPVVLAGSFNPLHEGHRGLLAAAETLTGRNGWYELAIANVDKPDLGRVELDRRLRQFRGHRGVLITRAPRFVEKARLIPGAAFAIGFDTAVRVVDDSYYDVEPERPGEPRWAGVLRELRFLGCSFVVAGRAETNGRFHELGELSIPSEFESMFVAIPQSMFRADVSSTEIRERGR